MRIKNLAKNHCLAKSINDAAWYQFRLWLEYFGVKYGKVTIAVAPQYTSQNCSDCGETVKKSLSTRTHACKCGCTLDRDENAARNILRIGLSTAGHTGTWLQDSLNAWGEDVSNEGWWQHLSKQTTSLNQESATVSGAECQKRATEFSEFAEVKSAATRLDSELYIIPHIC